MSVGRGEAMEWRDETEPEERGHVPTEVLTTFTGPATQTWNAGDSPRWGQEVLRAITPPRNIRLHSMGVSGGVSMVNATPGGPTISLIGGPEVWAKIVDPNNIYQYVSGPLATPVDFPNVAELWLGFGSLIANGGCTQVRYDIFVNANLVYELL